MNTTEIEVNDNDAAPLSSVSPASSFRDSSPTHNKRRNTETYIKDAIDQIKYLFLCIWYFAKIYRKNMKNIYVDDFLLYYLRIILYFISSESMF